MKIGRVGRSKVITVELEMLETEWVSFLDVLGMSASGWVKGTVHDALTAAVFPPEAEES